MIDLTNDRELIRFVSKRLDTDEENILILQESPFRDKIVVDDSTVDREEITVLKYQLDSIKPPGREYNIVRGEQTTAFSSSPSFAPELNVEFEKMGEAIEEMADQVANEVKQAVEELNRATMDLKEGDDVLVENVQGGTAPGTVIESKPYEQAGEWELNNGTTLYEYWKDRGEEISWDDGVVKVKLDAGTRYTYPASKVSPYEKDIEMVSGVDGERVKVLRDEGYDTVDDLESASQSELSEIEGIGNALAARIKADVGGITPKESDPSEMTHVGYICPNCDDSFSKNDPDAVEGDEGDMYCSIECLNEELMA